MPLKNILIASDDTSLALDIELHLKGVKWVACHLVSTVAEMNAICEKLIPEAIIADLRIEAEASYLWLKSYDPQTSIIIISDNDEDQHYQKALELNACAYLIKPFNSRSLQFLIERIVHKDSVAYYWNFIEGRRIFRIKYDEIQWIQTEGNYSTIWYGNTSIILKKSLVNLIKQLPEGLMQRAHRSVLVNPRYIHRYDPHKEKIQMEDGHELPVGSKYKEELIQLLLTNA